ncbi:MAG: GAF domain-containing protein [Actinomycetota bacterium]|nr:GAF domain-containing protein [Actinomycetota bacterium]
MSVLGTFIKESLDGIAVLDGNLRVLYMNEAGCEILGVPHEALVGETGLVAVPPRRREAVGQILREMLSGTGQGAATILRPSGEEREIEYTHVILDVSGEKLYAGIFRDISESGRTHLREAAFAEIAASAAYAGSLDATLDGVAASVVRGTEMVACAVVLSEANSEPLHVGGTFNLPEDYPRRFSLALAAGEPLPGVQAIRSGETVIVRRALDDPALGGDLDQDLSWGTLVCMPMVARGKTVGALKCFYDQGHELDPAGMGFLAAVADQAAVAVENARLFAQIAESSRRQEGLVQAGIALGSEVSLPALLEKIVELACNATGARYGAVGVLGTTGVIEDFITFGVTDDQHRAIGDLPVGQGILGALITDASVLRLRRIQDDPRSVGFPPNHPPMTSFLGVPIVVRGTIYGNLYLTEKEDAAEFTPEDESAAVTLAAQAGVAIENARLFEEAQARLALQERHRLAQELHDSVSQALFSLTLHARAAQLAFEQQQSIGAGKLESHLAELRHLTQAALAEMKALIFELRPEALREEGLVAALRKQADRIVARDEITVDVSGPNAPVVLPPPMEEELYRLSQEALANAVNHAAATRIAIDIQVTDMDEHLLMLEISDDGVGFDPSLPRPGHMGLTTMAARADRLGGTFEVRSAPGAGSTVRVKVPLQPERAATSRDERRASESLR